MSDKVNMVSADHYNAVKQERDQLRARVAELEVAVDRAIYKHEKTACNVDILMDDLKATFNRAPAQSLAAIEARVLRELAKKYKERLPDQTVTMDQVVRQLEWEADLIEKEGK